VVRLETTGAITMKNFVIVVKEVKQRKVVGKPSRCCVIDTSNRRYSRKEGKRVES